MTRLSGKRKGKFVAFMNASYIYMVDNNVEGITSKVLLDNVIFSKNRTPSSGLVLGQLLKQDDRFIGEYHHNLDGAKCKLWRIRDEE
tara:strand:+ start:341 stop:601 length:261 start_codon:yes stop_codon:yes gene_type:complete